MYTGLLHLHSVLRWIILILLLIAIFKSIAEKSGAFTSSHKKLGSFLTICCDITFLIGLYQWITGPLGLKIIQNVGMKEVMGNSYYRFFAIEHITAMIIAIALIHVGKSYAKKDIADPIKHKRTILFFGLALLIILISIPWPFREIGAGRHWLPGM